MIINADDYGLCHEVNDAIERLAEAGVLGGVSVLANGECCVEAIKTLRACPEISAGIHLNAVEGKPLAHPSQIRILLGEYGFFAGIGALIKRWLLHSRAVSHALEVEWRAQIERLLELGITITHADSHQHLHAFPPAFHCAVKLCREYGINAIRIPHERLNSASRILGMTGLRISLGLSRMAVPQLNLRHNDNFLGFKQAGNYGLKELMTDLQTLPAGLTELAIHPSTSNGYPYQHYKGRAESEALLDERFMAQLFNLGITLCNWREVV